MDRKSTGYGDKAKYCRASWRVARLLIIGKSLGFDDAQGCDWQQIFDSAGASGFSHSRRGESRQLLEPALHPTAEGIALSAASFQAPNVSVEETFLNISYAGKLSADGKSISGTWTQDKQTYPVIFVLATPETVWKQ